MPTAPRWHLTELCGSITNKYTAMAQYGNAYAAPWTRGLARGVAMNAPQYGRSEPCGMCVAYRGTGRGAGADPVPVAGLQYALVTDLCPECAHGEAPPLLVQTSSHGHRVR